MVRSGYFLFLPAFTAIVMLSSCGNHSQSGPENSDLHFRPYDPKEKNIFYVVGAPNGLAGVPTDVAEMAKVLGDATLGYNWTVNKNGNATKAEILSSLTRYAAEAGENGTIGLYVSGHGSNSGQFMTASGMLGFSEVATAIRNGRATPLRRLLTFNDSCFSGHWANGNGHLDDFDGTIRQLPTEASEPTEYIELTPEQENRLAANASAAIAAEIHSIGVLQNGVREFVTFAASRKDQTSLDFGAARGGAFTYALRQVFSGLRKDNPNATVNDLIEQTKTKTWQLTSHHNPVATFFPKTVTSEYLFRDGQGPTPTPTPTPSPTPPPGDTIDCPAGSTKHVGSVSTFRDKYCKVGSTSKYLAYTTNTLPSGGGTWWRWKANVNQSAADFVNESTGETRRFAPADLVNTR